MNAVPEVILRKSSVQLPSGCGFKLALFSYDVTRQADGKNIVFPLPAKGYFLASTALKVHAVERTRNSMHASYPSCCHKFLVFLAFSAQCTCLSMSNQQSTALLLAVLSLREVFVRSGVIEWNDNFLRVPTDAAAPSRAPLGLCLDG